MIDEIERHSFLTRALGPGATVVDLGVNRAAFSRAIAARYGCRVVGVEPLPDLHDALPTLPRVAVDQVAITGDGKPVTLFEVPGDCATMSPPARSEVAREVRVPGITLRALLERHGVERAALVKVDIEGAELPMFGSLDVETLERVDQFSVEFHDFLDPSQRPLVDACERKLRAAGFACIRLSRDNTDVLFAHPDRVALGKAERLWIRSVYKYGRGLQRMVRRRRA